MNQQPLHNILQMPADHSGCGTYRMFFPTWCARAIRKNLNIIDTKKGIPFKEYYMDIKLVRIQRQASPHQLKFVREFLKPVSKLYGFWLVYEIDDVVGANDIPKYNVGRNAYQDPVIQANIKEIMSMCDIITVTTQELANYYSAAYNIEMERFLIIPNYLPRWWIGEAYDIERIKAKFDKNNKKHRVGIVSSSTHYDIANQNNGQDDFTHIVDFIRKTVNKYQWVFVGGCPSQLIDLAKLNKIEVHEGSDILNYPRELCDKNLDVVVSPLQDNIFNRCKSNIKFIEMSALGIPVICQDLPLYSKYTDLVFTDDNGLQTQLDKVLKHKGSYINIVREKRNIIDYGDEHSSAGWWMEKNIGKWLQLFEIQQKHLTFDLAGRKMK